LHLSGFPCMRRQAVSRSYCMGRGSSSSRERLTRPSSPRRLCYLRQITRGRGRPSLQLYHSKYTIHAYRRDEMGKQPANLSRKVRLQVSLCWLPRPEIADIDSGKSDPSIAGTSSKTAHRTESCRKIRLAGLEIDFCGLSPHDAASELGDPSLGLASDGHGGGHHGGPGGHRRRRSKEQLAFDLQNLGDQTPGSATRVLAGASLQSITVDIKRRTLTPVVVDTASSSPRSSAGAAAGASNRETSIEIGVSPPWGRAFLSSVRADSPLARGLSAGEAIITAEASSVASLVLGGMEWHRAGMALRDVLLQQAPCCCPALIYIV